ncbi:MFS transporter [Aliiruegeria haliotis]|nr:MFS transporter [Aliiruegeria haliotis]
MTDTPLSSPATPSAPSDARARRNVLVLVAAQAILGAQMSMIFTVGGLAGGMLAPNPCLATLPISLIVIGSMTTAPWLSAAMQRLGRRAGFFIGAIGGATGAGVSAWGLWENSFTIFLAGSFLTGIYMSAQGFYRFAAADTASESFRPKAISYVLAGGLLSAFIGPTLGTSLADAWVVPFFGTYVGAAAINLVGMLLFLLLDIPRPAAPRPGAPRGRSRRELLQDPTVLVAIICAMVSYALMNLVMTSTPLAVVGCGYDTQTAGYVVTAHVLAMFTPSFFTGHLIARFGVRPIISLGLVILAGAGVVALNGVELENFFIALILLGLGWNFGFIGATTMLAGAHAPEERGRVQGMNDMLVFGCVALASLVSGGLMNCSGSSAAQGWVSVNLAMAPFLALAGGALIWLTLRPQE